MSISVDDATILLTVVSALAAYVVAWLRTVTWPGWVRFLVATGVSGVGGALAAYVAGELRIDASLVQNLAVVYLAARTFYYAFFQVLGLERILLPKAAIVTQARESSQTQLAPVDRQTARDALDSEKNAKLEVVAKVEPALVTH